MTLLLRVKTNRHSFRRSPADAFSINPTDDRPFPIRLLKRTRQSLARVLERRLIGREPVTIISEDCWGGEFCRVHGCAYTTPLAGAWIEPAGYLDFLENLGAPDAFDLHWVASQHAHPVARTPYATIHFQHARSWSDIDEAIPRRVARMNPARLFFKIDFGKPGYTARDVERWNALALPNAVAILPPNDPPGLDLDAVHQGVQVRAWTPDGQAMHHLSRRDFDFHHWLRTGEVRRSPIARALHFVLWDGHAPSAVRTALGFRTGRRASEPREPAPSRARPAWNALAVHPDRPRPEGPPASGRSPAVPGPRGQSLPVGR